MDRLQPLRGALEIFLESFPQASRLWADPVEFPHRFRRRPDIEVSAILSACLAYGRADLFRAKLEQLHRVLGRSPADFALTLTPASAARHLAGFTYRFNVAADVAVLLLGAGRQLRSTGTLESPIADALDRGLAVREALGALTGALREVDLAKVRASLGPERGLSHLLPSPPGPGAHKRLLLFLRWMVRGPDVVDFGLWSRVRPAQLVIPLDTHIGRLSRHLGFTRRRDLTWRTALEVTQALRRLSPDDPVRYDFALCHLGMSGACPARVDRTHCAACALAAVCRTGRRRLSP